MSKELHDISALDSFLNAALREDISPNVQLSGNTMEIPTEQGVLRVPLKGQTAFSQESG
ncbi:MAG: hypothetical protein ACK5II_11835 [Paracoccus sp. (in: a-proteobacteria)]